MKLLVIPPGFRISAVLNVFLHPSQLLQLQGQRGREEAGGGEGRGDVMFGLETSTQKYMRTWKKTQHIEEDLSFDRCNTPELTNVFVVRFPLDDG